MFEDIALLYSELPESQIRLLNYGLVILGGVLGGLTYRSADEIRPAHYFALTGFIFLCVAIFTVGSLAFIVQALSGGFFWLVVGLEMLATVAGGFFIARIACDRSRDAYGHGRMAALAFIPIANLWLLLTPTKNEFSAKRMPAIPLLKGGLGVFAGFLMFGAGTGLSTYAQVDAMKRVETAAAAGVFNVAMLDRTLVAMAADTRTPLRIDEATILLRMEATGSEIHYIYEVDPPLDFLPEEMRIGLLQKNCSFDGIAGVIDAGAVIKHVYQRKDASEIGVVEVTNRACGR